MIKMKAYIHAINGAPWNEECAAALHGFQALGIPCVLFSSTDELADRAPGDVVVGGTLITEHALKEYGALPPNYSYPYELKDFYGREIRRIKLRNLNEEGFPVFVKPVKDKLAPGMVSQALDDIHNTEYSFFEPGNGDPLQHSCELRFRVEMFCALRNCYRFVPLSGG